MATEAPLPDSEEERIEQLKSFSILDTEEEELFDEIARTAAAICETKISLISLVDSNRQWFKSHHGLEARETPRNISYCGHAILGDDVFIVEDSQKDERFRDNPLHLSAPHVRFYAGAPLVTQSGHKIGTLCVIDHEPRKLTKTQVSALKSLSRQVVSYLELRKNQKKISDLESNAKKLLSNMAEGFVIQNQKGEIVEFNDSALKILDVSADQLLGADQLDPKWQTIKEDYSPFPPIEHPSLVCLKTGKKVQDVIMGVMTPTNKLSWIKINSSPIKIDNESHCLTTFQDITQEKLQLNSKEEVLASISEGYWDWKIQEDFEYMSPKFWEILGIDPKTKKHHPGEWQKLIFPDDLKLLNENYDLHVESKGEHVFNQNVRYYHSDGRIIWVKYEGKVIEWDGDKPVRMVGTQRDVTDELKRTLDNEAYAKGLDTYAIVARTDFNGVITYVNDKFCQISGYDCEELIGNTHSLINSGYHDDAFFKNFWETIKSGKQWRGEIKNKAKNGDIYWVDTTITPALDDRGNVVDFFSFRYDITERKNKEKRDLFISQIRKQYIKSYEDPKPFFDYLLARVVEISDSEYGFIGRILLDENGEKYLKTYALTDISWDEKTRELFQNNSLEGLDFRNLDTLFGQVIKTETKLITNNPSEHESSGGLPFGHPPLKSFLGIPFFQSDKFIGMVGVANRAIGYSEEFYQFIAPLIEVIGETVGSYHLQKQIKRKDHELLEALRIIEIQNKILTVSTQDKPLTEKLKDSLDIVLSIDWLSIKKQGGIFLKKDNADKLILTAQYDLATPLLSICREIDFGECLCGRAAKERKTIFTGCVDHRHENTFEGMKPHGHYSVPIFYGEKLQGVIVLYLDHGHIGDESEVNALERISQSIGTLIYTSKVKEQLEKQERFSFHNAKLASLGQLAAGVGHEINNPMAIVKGHTSFLKKYIDQDTPNREKFNESLNIINLAVDRVTTIVKGLKTFSRSDMGDFTTFNMSVMLFETVDMLKEIYVKEAVSIEVDIESDLYIMGDRGRLQQVIINLFSNAKDAMKGKFNKIILTAKSSFGSVEIWVRDNGAGIPDDIIDKVFDPFFTSKGVNEGTGIGLALSHQIVVEHSGKLEIESTGVNGTTFYISLKQAAFEKTVSENIHPEPSIEAAEISGTVLIVEDEKPIRDIIELFVSEFGHKVITAENGRVAWDLYQKESASIDIIITDMQMPEMDGQELLTKIHSFSDSRPGCLIITGGVNINFEDQNSDLGKLIDGFIPKPFDMDIVGGKIKDLLIKNKSK